MAIIMAIEAILVSADHVGETSLTITGWSSSSVAQGRPRSVYYASFLVRAYSYEHDVRAIHIYIWPCKLCIWIWVCVLEGCHASLSTAWGQLTTTNLRLTTLHLQRRPYSFRKGCLAARALDTQQRGLGALTLTGSTASIGSWRSVEMEEVWHGPDSFIKR